MNKGLVVARHRHHVTVEASNGHRYSCRTLSRQLQPLVGDRVEWREEPGSDGVITQIEPRTSLLTRVDSRGRGQPVAANLTQLVIVVAAEPAIDWLVLDHYLAAAEIARLKSVIVYNKTDIEPELPTRLNDYAEIAEVITTSAFDRSAQLNLADAMQGERSAFVGQSGVGKSSLINTLLGEELQAVGELSEKIRQGRHTTTAATLYRLANGGELIDSPGVRQYAPYIEHERDVADGFKEIRELSGHCRFDNCQHLAEPDCAVKAAVESGTISRERHENYKNLQALVATLRAKREA